MSRRPSKHRRRFVAAESIELRLEARSTAGSAAASVLPVSILGAGLSPAVEVAMQAEDARQVVRPRGGDASAPPTGPGRAAAGHAGRRVGSHPPEVGWSSNRPVAAPAWRGADPRDAFGVSPAALRARPGAQATSPAGRASAAGFPGVSRPAGVVASSLEGPTGSAEAHAPAGAGSYSSASRPASAAPRPAAAPVASPASPQAPRPEPIATAGLQERWTSTLDGYRPAGTNVLAGPSSAERAAGPQSARTRGDDVGAPESVLTGLQAVGGFDVGVGRADADLQPDWATRYGARKDATQPSPKADEKAGPAQAAPGSKDGAKDGESTAVVDEGRGDQTSGPVAYSATSAAFARPAGGGADGLIARAMGHRSGLPYSPPGGSGHGAADLGDSAYERLDALIIQYVDAVVAGLAPNAGSGNFPISATGTDGVGSYQLGGTVNYNFTTSGSTYNKSTSFSYSFSETGAGPAGYGLTLNVNGSATARSTGTTGGAETNTVSGNESFSFRETQTQSTSALSGGITTALNSSRSASYGGNHGYSLAEARNGGAIGFTWTQNGNYTYGASASESESVTGSGVSQGATTSHTTSGNSGFSSNRTGSQTYSGSALVASTYGYTWTENGSSTFNTTQRSTGSTAVSGGGLQGASSATATESGSLRSSTSITGAESVSATSAAAYTWRSTGTAALVRNTTATVTTSESGSTSVTNAMGSSTATYSAGSTVTAVANASGSRTHTLDQAGTETVASGVVTSGSGGYTWAETGSDTNAVSRTGRASATEASSSTSTAAGVTSTTASSFTKSGTFTTTGTNTASQDLRETGTETIAANIVSSGSATGTLAETASSTFSTTESGVSSSTRSSSGNAAYGGSSSSGSGNSSYGGAPFPMMGDNYTASETGWSTHTLDATTTHALSAGGGVSGGSSTETLSEAGGGSGNTRVTPRASGTSTVTGSTNEAGSSSNGSSAVGGSITMTMTESSSNTYSLSSVARRTLGPGGVVAGGSQTLTLSSSGSGSYSMSGSGTGTTSGNSLGSASGGGVTSGGSGYGGTTAAYNLSQSGTSTFSSRAVVTLSMGAGGAIMGGSEQHTLQASGSDSSSLGMTATGTYGGTSNHSGSAAGAQASGDSTPRRTVTATLTETGSSSSSSNETGVGALGGGGVVLNGTTTFAMTAGASAASSLGLRGAESSTENSGSSSSGVGTSTWDSRRRSRTGTFTSSETGSTSQSVVQGGTTTLGFAGSITFGTSSYTLTETGSAGSAYQGAGTTSGGASTTFSSANGVGGSSGNSTSSESGVYTAGASSTATFTGRSVGSQAVGAGGVISTSPKNYTLDQTGTDSMSATESGTRTSTSTSGANYADGRTLSAGGASASSSAGLTVAYTATTNSSGTGSLHLVANETLGANGSVAGSTVVATAIESGSLSSSLGATVTGTNRNTAYNLGNNPVHVQGINAAFSSTASSAASRTVASREVRGSGGAVLSGTESYTSTFSGSDSGGGAATVTDSATDQYMAKSTTLTATHSSSSTYGRNGGGQVNRGAGGTIANGSEAGAWSLTASEGLSAHETGSETVTEPLGNGTATSSLVLDRTSSFRVATDQSETRTIGQGGAVTAGSNTYGWTQAASEAASVALTGGDLSANAASANSNSFVDAGSETLGAGAAVTGGSRQFTWDQGGSNTTSMTYRGTGTRTFALNVVDRSSASWHDVGTDTLGPGGGAVAGSDSYTLLQGRSTDFSVSDGGTAANPYSLTGTGFTSFTLRDVGSATASAQGAVSGGDTYTWEESSQNSSSLTAQGGSLLSQASDSYSVRTVGSRTDLNGSPVSSQDAYTVSQTHYNSGSWSDGQGFVGFSTASYSLSADGADSFSNNARSSTMNFQTLNTRTTSFTLARTTSNYSFVAQQTSSTTNTSSGTTSLASNGNTSYSVTNGNTGSSTFSISGSTFNPTQPFSASSWSATTFNTRAWGGNWVHNSAIDVNSATGGGTGSVPGNVDYTPMGNLGASILPQIAGYVIGARRGYGGAMHAGTGFGNFSYIDYGEADLFRMVGYQVTFNMSYGYRYDEMYPSLVGSGYYAMQEGYNSVNWISRPDFIGYRRAPYGQGGGGGGGSGSSGGGGSSGANYGVGPGVPGTATTVDDLSPQQLKNQLQQGLMGASRPVPGPAVAPPPTRVQQTNPGAGLDTIDSILDRGSLRGFALGTATGDAMKQDLGQIASYVSQSASQVVQGNYTPEGQKTVLGSIGEVGAGFMPVVSTVASARDLNYDLTHWEWSFGHAFQTTMDAASLVPFVRGGAKLIFGGRSSKSSAGATGAGTQFFGSSKGSLGGRIPLDDVPVTLQPTRNTCVAASLDMLLEHHVPGRAFTSLESFKLSKNGLASSDAMGFIDSNFEAIGLSLRRGSLSQAMGSGQPFIAFVTEGSQGHAVVVQGIRELDDIIYLIVRDPGRGAYLERLLDFDARLVRDTTVLGFPTVWGE